MMVWRQLRWQIVGAQMGVVLVGVATLVAGAHVVTTATVTPELLPPIRHVVTQALVFAALASALVGLATALLLTRQIMRPLREIAASSQRIADGHYEERVGVPSSDELRMMAESFNQMAAALGQVEQQRVALLGNMAHELRTPLAGLEGYVEGLIDGVFAGDAETLAMMQRELRRMRRLVDDLQALSRVEAGQIALAPTCFDLSEVARAAVAQLRPQLMGGGLSLDLDAAGAVMVYADCDRTTQILLNLIGNAIRYTPERGQIRVAVGAGGGVGLVEVADTGVGIPPEALPYLFERFYRVDPSRSRASGGSGIGLTIARHLAWAMGGDVRAASAGPGQGSMFTLELPMAKS